MRPASPSSPSARPAPPGSGCTLPHVPQPWQAQTSDRKADPQASRPSPCNLSSACPWSSPASRRLSPACLHSHKILQLVPQRLVGPEQKRLRCTLAQLQHLSNLPVIHSLVLVHQHCHPLPFRQRHHMI